MADMNAIATDTVIIREPGGTELRWRAQRMASLGADATLAAEIANSRADVHDIERLLDAGCPLELAWAITRPVSEPEAAVTTTQEASSSENSD